MLNTNVRADWNLRELALSVARNEVGANIPEDEFLQSEAITLAEYTAIAANPQFRRYVKDFKADLEENGFSFAAKCRVLAEDLLATAYNMAKDSDTPAAVRAKTLENFVEWGNLKPKGAAFDAVGAGYSITINLPASAGNSANATPLTLVSRIPDPPSIVLPSESPSVPITAGISRGTPLRLDSLEPYDSGYYAAEAMEGGYQDPTPTPAPTLP